MLTWSMAFMMTSKKSGHENSGFKLQWQMVCVLLTAGCMWIRYVLLKGFGWATERNATSLPHPGCCAAGQAESSVGKGDGTFPEKSWEGKKTVRQDYEVSRGNVPLVKGELSDRAESGTCSEVLLPDAQRGLRGLDAIGEAGMRWQD